MTDQNVADADAILERRARELAREPDVAPHGAAVDVVEFRLAGERYAIRAAEIRAVFFLHDLVPLPGAVAPLLGLTLWRGDLLPLLDVRAELGLSSVSLDDLRTVIVLGEGNDTTALLVDEVDGRRVRQLEEFGVVTAGPQRRKYARGLSSDAVTLLDGSALARAH